MACNGGFIPLESFKTKFKFHNGVRQIGAPRSEAGATVTMGWNEAMLAQAQGWGEVDIGRRPHHQRPHLMEGGRAPDHELYPDDGKSAEERAQQRVAAVRASSSSAVSSSSSTFRATASAVVAPASSAPLCDELMSKPLTLISCRALPDQRLGTKAEAEHAVVAGLHRSWLALRSRLQRVCAGKAGQYASRKVLRIADNVGFVGDTSPQGKPHGEGVLLLADGSQHVGRFLAGRADGPGFYFTPKGLVVQGSWKENLRVGAFVCINDKGEVFHEQYSSDGKRNSRRRASTSSESRPVLEDDKVAEAEPLLHELPSRCSMCNALFHHAFDHPYACRRHSGESSSATGQASGDCGRWSCSESASCTDLGCEFSCHTVPLET